MARQTATNKEDSGINVVIAGGGIIGVCTAYYLAQRENVTSITIIERYKIAGCASGKAGGFLALDWCDNGWLEPLARKSFQLHNGFAKKYGNKYFYRRCAAYSIDSKYSLIQAKSKLIANYNDLQWLDCKILQHKVLGSKHTNAQIHPRMFCETLIDLVKNKVDIKYGIVTGMIFDKVDKNKVISVKYISNNINKSELDHEQKNEKNEKIQDNTQSVSQLINCDFVVIALGPWSRQSSEWFPQCKNLTKITSYKYNSIVVQPDYNENLIKKQQKTVDHGAEIKNDNNALVEDGIATFLHSKTDVNVNKNEMKENDIDELDEFDENVEMKCLNSLEGAVFLKHKCKNGKSINIEIYPRSDGTIYCCGPAKRTPLPKDPSSIKGDDNIENIYNGLKELSSKYLCSSKLIIKQACYLPESEDNAPFIGQITNYKNAFIGTAHQCWGILNAPATGVILSELIVDGKVSVISNDALQRWSLSRS